tara:strand:+ start:666 stop:1427 length:762 start_codon:yes stop_codon:yes gene_type:complete
MNKEKILFYWQKRALNRVLDIIISLLAILILSPFFLLIIVILRFTAEGEVFYFQERIGQKNSKFQIWKFATMMKNSINLGSGSITLKNDFRVTKFGRILRITKINELPQLVNLLKGDLTIVGPRALVTKTFSAYSEDIQSTIYNAKPGITGIGSIVFRDEESLISSVTNEDPFDFYKRVIAPHKGKLEIWYYKNKTITTNFKLILLTIWVILSPTSTLYQRWFKDLPVFNPISLPKSKAKIVGKETKGLVQQY